MKQYLDLITAIEENGTFKPAARANMPGTQSLFGHQFRVDLQRGFPLLTTKKINFNNIAIELQWFLRGDTNIKYLVDRGFNMWNQDAFNYYCAKMKGSSKEDMALSFESFIKFIKTDSKDLTDEDKQHLPDCMPSDDSYVLGDCGFQYGKVWRDWESNEYQLDEQGDPMSYKHVDQLQRVVDSLRKAPQGRRHLVTAIDPAHDEDLALYWCHSLFQFNARPLSYEERIQQLYDLGATWEIGKDEEYYARQFSKWNVPTYFLDCQLYQRSADTFLGVPYNIASYAALTHLIAAMVGMIPGHYIHTFGDVHIYENHQKAIETQKPRAPFQLPKLEIPYHHRPALLTASINDVAELEGPELFHLTDYLHHPFIKATLSTGMEAYEKNTAMDDAKAALKKHLANLSPEEKAKLIVDLTPEPQPSGWISIDEALPKMKASDLMQGYTEFVVKYKDNAVLRSRVSDHDTWKVYALETGITHWKYDKAC